MSDLHLALLGVAGVLLAALFGYNKWQERRVLRELDASLRGNAGDPLLRPTVARVRVPPAAAATDGAGADDLGVEAAHAPTPAVEVTDLPLSALYGRGREGRVEPRLDLPPLAGDVDAHVEPTEDQGDDDAPGAAHGEAATPRWVEDPMIDWVLELRCSHAVDGVAVFDAAAPLARLDSTLPLFLVVWDARSQQWVEPDRFGFYSELLVAVQMAHRSRTLDEITASRFVAVVQQIAMGLDADFDVPDVKRVVATADELDRLLARFDVQIGITLQSTGGPWAPARVAQAASAAHMLPAGSDRWERLDESGQPMFSLRSDPARPDALALELDVPLVPIRDEPLRALLKAADLLAMELSARLIDDNGRPVNAASLSGIAEQLDALYAEMRGAGIEPGGARARRLYAVPVTT